MAFCLIPKYATKFKEALKSGEINPDKLVSMSSDERRAYLEPFVGEFNAKFANTLFESKLLLKNQQMGLITWAKKLGGITESSRSDLISKIEKLGTALTPTNEKGFLSDIVEQRLGTRISSEEAKTITDLTSKMKSLYDTKLPNWEQPKEYWQTKQQLMSYMRDITPQFDTSTAKGKINSVVENALSIQRAIKTGFDLSAALRQGAALFGTKEWIGAFKRMFEYAKSQTAIDRLETEILSNRYSEYALKNKRALGLTLLGEKFTQREEQFAAKITEKIPFLKGSERAFTGFLNDLRFNRFVNILNNLEKVGKGITENQEAMKSLAEVIGASTGRGTLGAAEGAARSLATVLFSPRWVASRVQMITNPLLKSGVARTEAIKSLARLAGIAVSVLGMAKMAGLGVETDTRSSDFGKIKVGTTRFDLTGGLGPYIVLLARGATLKTKSSITGRVQPLNSGKYGAPTMLDVLTNFLMGKASPLAGIARDIMQGKSFSGQKVKVGLTKDFAEYVAQQLGEPLLASDSLQAFQSASGGMGIGVAATLSSLLGIGVNTY